MLILHIVIYTNRQFHAHENKFQNINFYTDNTSYSHRIFHFSENPLQR